MEGFLKKGFASSSVGYSTSGAIGDAAGFGGATSSFSSFGGSHGSNAEIDHLFASVDKSGDGFISIEEAQSLLLRLNSRLGRNYGEDDVKAFFARLDVNRDGRLSIREFREAFGRI